MVLGTYGKIIFQTSKDKTLTFGKLSEKVGGKYADIQLLRGKPREQYIRAELESIDLDITVRADLGYKPRDIIQQLKKMAEVGVAEPLIIGGRPVSELPLIIISMSAEWDVVYSQGQLFQATISLSLAEYR